MLFFVTCIGSLIHVYSVGYMDDDPGYGALLLYLNLFIFAMLMLVLGDNLPSCSSAGKAWASARTS